MSSSIHIWMMYAHLFKLFLFNCAVKFSKSQFLRQCTLPNKICYFLWRTFIEEEFFRKWPGGAVYWYVLQLFRCGAVSMLMLVKALI